MYTIDIKGDQTYSKSCYNISNEGGIQRFSEVQIKRFYKAKAKEEEEPKEGDEK